MGRVKAVFLDTNTIIDLIELHCLVEVLGTPGTRFLVTENVLQEIIYPGEKTLVAEAVANGLLDQVDLTEMEIISEYAMLKGMLGDGEAATLAVASHSGMLMASDEKGRFRREALRRLGQQGLLGTADLIADAVAHGRHNLDDLEVRVQELVDMAAASGLAQPGEHYVTLLSQIRDKLGIQESLG